MFAIKIFIDLSYSCIMGVKDLFQMFISNVYVITFGLLLDYNKNGSIRPPWVNLNFRNFGLNDHLKVVVTRVGIHPWIITTKKMVL